MHLDENAFHFRGSECSTCGGMDVPHYSEIQERCRGHFVVLSFKDQKTIVVS